MPDIMTWSIMDCGILIDMIVYEEEKYEWR